MLNRYRKSIVAVLGAVVLILESQGVTGFEDVPQEVIALLTALGVFTLPNDE